MRSLALFLCLIAGVYLWAAEAAPPPSLYHAELVSAIQQRHRITFVYGDERLDAEPHAYGLSKQEQPLLRAYVSAPSVAGSGEPAWLLFRVDRMSELTTQEQAFAAARPGYRRGDKAMSVIFAEY